MRQRVGMPVTRQRDTRRSTAAATEVTCRSLESQRAGRPGEGVVRGGGEAGRCMGSVQAGNMYYQGEGVKQDYSKAREWFEMAAKQEQMAQFNVGALYKNGDGVTQSYSEAIE